MFNRRQYAILSERYFDVLLGDFGALLWMVIDWGLVDADSFKAITYIILVILCGILAIGISWSHIRRRMTGQVDVDEVEGDL